MAVSILRRALEPLTTGVLYASRIRVIALCALVSILAFGLYARTGAPSLLIGDQAEHQMVAVIGGVPHATGYPLFTTANMLAVRLLPVGDAARRATLMTALWSALAVLLAFLVAHRISGSSLAGLLSATTLAVSPRFWSLSIITEVYTFQAALILAVWYALLCWWEAPQRIGWLAGMAFLSGIATTHHGSFVPIVFPALICSVVIIWRSALRTTRIRTLIVHPLIAYGLGLTPWLYLAFQFVRYRPFDYYRGQGLPYHYYWGNPTNWVDVANLALGAGFRSKILTHGWEHFSALSLAFGTTLRGEVWWSGLVLGIIGIIALARAHRPSAVFSSLIFIGAAVFGITVAGDVPKAPVYYLPAYVIWSVWVGTGAGWIAARIKRLRSDSGALLASALLIGLLIVPLARGWRQFDQVDRSADWMARQFAEGVLAEVDPDAVILCRWEQCRTIQYLQLAEGRRLDVQLDQTEPEDGVSWADRAALYYPAYPVYALSFNQTLAERYPIYPISESYDLWQIRPLE